MDIYSYRYEYLINSVLEFIEHLLIGNSQFLLAFCSFSILCVVILLNRKIKRLERIQINEISDVTSFNRLIDDEIGLLKEECDELNKNYNKAKQKDSFSDTKLFNNAPYSQAVNLAKRGYTRNEIISLCSLTESEADLILTLHASTKAA